MGRRVCNGFFLIKWYVVGVGPFFVGLFVAWDVVGGFVGRKGWMCWRGEL